MGDIVHKHSLILSDCSETLHRVVLTLGVIKYCDNLVTLLLWLLSIVVNLVILQGSFSRHCMGLNPNVQNVVKSQ